MPSPDNTDELKDLVKILHRKKGLTAREIAARTQASKVVVYRRLRRLSERGCQLLTVPVRDGSTGPMSMSYRLLPNRASKRLTQSNGKC